MIEESLSSTPSPFASVAFFKVVVPIVVDAPLAFAAAFNAATSAISACVADAALYNPAGSVEYHPAAVPLFVPAGAISA